MRLSSNFHITVQMNTFHSWPSEDIFFSKYILTPIFLLFSGKGLPHTLEHSPMRKTQGLHHLPFFLVFCKTEPDLQGLAIRQSPHTCLQSCLEKCRQKGSEIKISKAAQVESICFHKFRHLFMNNCLDLL